MKRVIHYALLLMAIAIPLSVIVPRMGIYATPYYTDDVYKSLERAFNKSQYRIKENPSIIPDETLFSYVAGAYLSGMDPIMANSEHTPLGKYFLAFSIFLFRNDKTIILFFALLSGFGIWLLGKRVLNDGTVALVPVLLTAADALFRNQLVTVPLLDIIQLPFIYLSLVAFLSERKRAVFFWTAFSLGCVMATKTIVPGLLLMLCMAGLLFIRKEYPNVLRFLCWLPVSAAVFTATYARTFLNGYTLMDFIGFQKWIFLYQKSKLIYPFSSLRLLLFNQWQTWWGTYAVVPANDWSILWPLSTVATFGLIVWFVVRKQWKGKEMVPATLLILWTVIYHALLSLGVVSSRFFIPLLPAQYILTVYAVLLCLGKRKKPKFV